MTFLDRHLGPRPSDLAAMLETVGAGSLEELIDKAVPSGIRDDRLELPDPLSEVDALARMRDYADQNTVLRSLIGQGYYGTITPGVIQRNVLENPGWYTAYTPYQPEISQGRLEALTVFQTMVADLTGMALANASLLDEGTAAAEAMALAHRASKSGSDVFFVDADAHPQTIDVIRTRAGSLGFEVVVGDVAQALEHGPFGLLVQYPGTSGSVRDLSDLIAAAHDGGAVVTVAADLLALTLLRPPGEMGADIVVGTSQRFGVPMGYGGPHAAYMAVTDAHTRSLPGRLVGVSVDSGGRTAYRLALQTREQHIRRERATSNICTAQVLLAVMAALYAVYHGPAGLTEIARRVHELTSRLAASLEAGGLELVNSTWFDTLCVRVESATDVLEQAVAAGYNLRLVDATTVGVSFDETVDEADLAAVCDIFGVAVTDTAAAGWTDELARSSEFLTHPTFHRYRSETEMLRYLRRLQDKDIALDRSMIPLGSCTMKLNATSEMVPITWPEFADLHPFAPIDQATGYVGLIAELETWLAEITGYDAVSVQPNAGSQGEYAGLLAIRAYHESRGEPERDVCLIPSSAHGTNPASAAMAGLRVVVVECDENGNVDVTDLSAKAAEHADRLAALMVTYPSTHGVFEEAISEICDIVHDHGGQVYLDGANLNAMVGIAKPGWFGSDVSHLNLHKTFTIPHGGGGPGVGPIGVKAHLAPFLPGHRTDDAAGPVGPVASARWGSAGILPISWMYIAMMGAAGMRAATEVAILNANYVAKRLEGHFDVLYTGAAGLVAHECIIDIRPLHRTTEVTVDDIAKRLVDYGFHAPTMSFPVAGTLMIEPTESESKEELDRFCEAMIAIRQEIAAIEQGEVAHADSALAHAPHTAEDLVAVDWDRPYARRFGAYPVPGIVDRKYWPPVSRIDARYGDRNIMCACPPIDEWR